MLRSFASFAVPALLLGSQLAQAVDPLVNLHYTSYLGTAYDSGVTQWVGVRFAAPPLGDLRFSAPIDPPANDTVQAADTVGPTCFFWEDAF